MKNQLSRRVFLQVAASGAIIGGLDPQMRSGVARAQSKGTEPDWSLNATIIDCAAVEDTHRNLLWIRKYRDRGLAKAIIAPTFKAPIIDCAGVICAR